MSAEEQIATSAAAEESTPAATSTDSAKAEAERSEKILKAKELYSHGSRNYLVKSYAEAADELSQVCSLYEELHGELSDELGMPYLLYAKSLIALALDENKVIDVPDAEDDDDDEEEEVDEEGDNDAEAEANGAASSSSSTGATSAAANGSKKLDSIKENGDEADSSVDAKESPTKAEKGEEEAEVSSSGANEEEQKLNGKSVKKPTAAAVDDEKPSTSNGEATNSAASAAVTTDDVAEEEEEENEAASSLQLAWEILELAAKIFSRQGLSGLANLAEVQTELANIEFENSILDAARDDYEKALKIYADLPTNYRRAMAEIHYKIGLTYLMQQLNKEGAASLKNACALIEAEIEAIKEKDDASEKDKNTIQDLEETKQEIWAKITEIEEMQAQTIAEVRAALDSYIKPMSGSGADNSDGAGPSSSTAAATVTASTTTSTSTEAKANGAASSSSSAISSSSKPTDISHLIKRKKPEEPNSEAEALCSPAKRAAV